MQIIFKMTRSPELSDYGLFVNTRGLSVNNDVASTDLPEGTHSLSWTLIGDPPAKINIKILDENGALIGEVKESKIRRSPVHHGNKYFRVGEEGK